MKKILIHLQAFGSNVLYVFDGIDGQTLSASKNEDLLERIFRECNHVDGTEWIADKKLRSLSVDDIVIFVNADNTVERFRVEGCGWTKLSNTP